MSVALIERVWESDAGAGRAARAVLAPGAWVYGGVTAMRNALYDRGLLAMRRPAIPALSLGNLSVGGTGKTPIAAWAVSELTRRGGHPTVVLRGYGGGDEVLVHERLNPAVRIVANPDRVAAAADAARLGADCVVLDDAFQHRRIARVADWVLVAAEHDPRAAARLPAGPLREGVEALGRATLVIVTRKTASAGLAAALADELADRVPGRAAAVVHLAPDAIVSVDDARREAASVLNGRAFVAVAAIGAPRAFFAQLRALGAVIDEASYRDHHRFTAADVRALERRAIGTDGVLCTLKDAVKLQSLWRGAGAPLWYVSQTAAIERGLPFLTASLEAVLAARLSLP